MHLASAKVAPNGLFGTGPRENLAFMAGFGHRVGCTNRCDKYQFCPRAGVNPAILGEKSLFRFTVMLQLV